MQKRIEDEVESRSHGIIAFSLLIYHHHLIFTFLPVTETQSMNLADQDPSIYNIFMQLSSVSTTSTQLSTISALSDSADLY